MNTATQEALADLLAHLATCCPPEKQAETQALLDTFLEKIQATCPDCRKPGQPPPEADGPAAGSPEAE